MCDYLVRISGVPKLVQKQGHRDQINSHYDSSPKEVSRNLAGGYCTGQKT